MEPSYLEVVKLTKAKTPGKLTPTPQPLYPHLCNTTLSHVSPLVNALCSNRLCSLKVKRFGALQLVLVRARAMP